MKSHSIIRRATAIVLAIEMICGVCFAVTAIVHERHALLHALDATLRGRSDSLVGAIQDAEDPQDNVKVDPEEFAPGPGDLFAVYGAHSKLVGATQGETPLPPQSDAGYSNLLQNGHRYRVLQRTALRIIDRTETNGQGLRRPVTVVYAIRADHIWHETLEAARFYVLLSIGLLCVTAVLLILLLRTLLRPLEELAATASSIDPATMQFSPPETALHTRELRPLAEAIAQSVARLRNAFAMERRFIGDAAHELKTAVAVVRSSVQVQAMRERPAADYRAGLDQILADNRRVEELVTRMLTLARFEERAAAPEVAVDLGEQVRDAVTNLASFAELRGVALKPALEQGVDIRLTPESVQALVSNLIVNAVQHSPQGSEVLVQAQRNSGTAGWAVLAVQDFGTGIAPESLPHVFERFFREDPSRSRESGGAGLGLAICKSIVENAGGSIEIRSAKGAGTTVTVLLPAA